MDKKIRIKRLRKLDYMLENHSRIFPDVMLDLGTYFERVGDEFIACTITCASAYPPFIEQGLYFNAETENPTYQGETGIFAAVNFFGISFDEAASICHPRSNDTPVSVASRVKELIKLYAV